MALASSPRSESQPATTTTSTFDPNNNTISSSSASTSGRLPTQTQPPAVTITPASPSATPASTTSVTLEPPIHPSTSQPPAAEMKEKSAALPTDSKTALLNNSRSSTAGSKEGGSTDEPPAINGRVPSTAGPAAPTPASNTATTTTEKPFTSTAPQTTSQTTSSPQTSSTSSKPSTTKPIQRASQKKKRKRKGLAGLLLALGCLSVDEFEDEPKAATKTQPQTSAAGASAPSSSAAKQDITAVTSAPGPSKTAESAAAPGAGHSADATGTTSTTLVATETPVDSSKAGEAGVQQEKEIVLAPTEPHILPEEETAGVTSSAVQPPGGGSSSLLGTPSRPHPQRRESETAAEPTSDVARTETSAAYSESELADESNAQTGDEGIEEYIDEDYEDEEDRLIEQGGMGIPIDENGQPAPLLPQLSKVHLGRKCLVLDLDETLLHSSFKSLPTADYIVPVEIESQIHNVYVIKRPGVDNFLKEMGKIYEIVVFTASLSKYADPVLDMLDTHGVVTHRLFRESCYNHKGNYVKDLSQLGRDIETSIIIDNSPASYIFHPNNAVPVSTWFNDPHDTELTDLCPFLADLATVDDVRGVLDGRLSYAR